MNVIIRVEHNKDKPYVLISKEMLKDQAIDVQSKGFLTYLLSKPDDWKIRPEKLAEEIKEGRATVYRLLKKLIRAKYIHREIFKRRDQKTGRFQTGTMYVVFESKECRQEWVDKERFAYEQSKGNTVSQNQDTGPKPCLKIKTFTK